MVFLELHSPPVISFAGYQSLLVERAAKKVMVSMQITALTFKTSDGNWVMDMLRGCDWVGSESELTGFQVAAS
jgi:hypothetical protein